MSNSINVASQYVVNAGVSGVLGYGAAALFTTINPIHGAVFCGISSLVSRVVTPFFDKIFNKPESNSESRFVGSVLKIVVGVGAAAAITTLAGFPITWMSGLIMTAAVTATTVLTLLAFTAGAALVAGCYAFTASKLSN